VSGFPGPRFVAGSRTTLNIRWAASVSSRMRTILLGAAMMGTLLVALPSTQGTARASDSLERPFASNGRIAMDLSAGEYDIVGTSASRIRMDWTVGDRDRLADVRARADIRGADATIRTDRDSSHGSFKVAIQVPRRADLRIRLTAGELTIEGIEGHKDVRLHAGELNIDVGRAADYERVEASAWAGDVDASAFGLSREGLFPSVDWHGKGPYRLKASLKAGEVRLYSGSSSVR
jgi:hypothetical protein